MYSSEDMLKAIQNFLNGSASEEEHQMVNAWYYSFNDEEVIIDAGIHETREAVKERMTRRLKQLLEEEKIRIPENVRINTRKTKWYAVAASTIILLAAAGWLGYYTLSPKKTKPAIVAQPLPIINDVLAPASAKAVLTLADGSSITLDNASDGSLALQGKTRVMKLSGDVISYENNSRPTGEVLYNTLTVPRGSRIVTLQLADGTLVWLNAQSSLHYPVAYSGEGELKVDITGEAYFEVSKKPAGKFIVNAGDTRTEVLGTHFNVNAYADNGEAVKVTLLEGSVKVAGRNANAVISPGQQAMVSADGPVSIDKKADLEEVMAWKSGYFHFNREELQSIMRKLERWYNVDITYEGQLKTLTFGGAIPRKENVSAVLDLLQMTGVVNFRITGSENGRQGKIVVKCN